jgi:HTH-type transcriptional regulator, transcriptional repressor of NAD biosynthesis genes
MEKRYKNGFIIGKFLPLHKGHQYVIETALKQCENLIVVVCQNQNIIINPEIRAGWIKELYPDVDVRVFYHDASLDSTSTEISPLWAKITIKLLGFVPDVVFSSESYGEVYAKCMGSKHVMVDIKRIKYPISGTKVRLDPLYCWEYLSEPVRAYYTKRIVVLGAESTGTTTLAKDLADHYRTTWVPEYGRIYSEGRLTAKNLKQWSSDEFLHIAITQNNLEDALARKSNQYLICDTDAFATRLWHDRYMGFFLESLDSVANIQNKSLYILTGDEIPFVQDGTRDGENIRHRMHQKFISELESHQLKYILVTGDRESRLKQAVKEIDKLPKKRLTISR